jgi:5'-nucleotidase/UDP-sugar diphosphatase
MITDSWLAAIPSADVSLTNQSGIRQSIPAGEITLATIVGVLPFENLILQLDLRGDQLIECAHGLEMGGMTTVNGYRLMDGTPLHPDSAYIVVTTDYLYTRDDIQFRQYDPEPFETGIHFRQPVIDWIRSLNTSASNPLNQYLDGKNRR